MNWEVLKAILLVASLTLGGLVLGYIFEKLIVRKIRKATSKTETKVDDIIIHSLRKLFILWFALLGLYIGMKTTTLPTKWIDTINKTILILFMFSGVIVASRLSVGLVQYYLDKFSDVLPPSSIFINLTRITVYVIGILMILQTLGISIAPILTALGVGSLAVALALQDTLSNLFAGIQILVSRQIRPGDYIKTDIGIEGYVKDINWRNTVIVSLSKLDEYIIPNAKLASAVITNHYRPNTIVGFSVDVGVSYSTDLEKAERIAIETAKEVLREVEGGVPEMEPFVRYYEFGDSSINFRVIMRAREFVYQFRLRHEYIKRLKKRFDEEGIEIPFPQRDVWIRSTNGIQTKQG